MENSASNFPKTDVLGFLDFLLEDYLMEVNDSNHLSCVPIIREHLVFLKDFMGKLAELRNHQENLHQDVWTLAGQMAYKIELLIDQLVLGDVLDSFSVSLQSITEDIMALDARQEIFNDEGRQEISRVQEITSLSADEVLSTSSGQIADEVVGFENEQVSIVNQLMGGKKKLQVVAVFGMPGLGKTTLASKVYSSHAVSHYFHVKARCSISQVFDKRKVLLDLLNQIQPGKIEDDLSQQLWRSLRRRKYLIFMDDIWDTEAFDLLIKSFPDDSNGSRILLTSQKNNVVPEALLDENPIFLRHLTIHESWELLQRKLFPAQKDWPSAFDACGMEIAESCKGLPLTIVIVAGLLKTMEIEGWKGELKTLKSSIISDQCKSIIELSYRHLPDHLKPCFLWFGAFPEDHEFSAKELIWFWIADGIVRESNTKSPEAVATDYLNDLIGRSLVMNVKERSTRGVKACRVHDLLHDFCLRKTNEDSFLHLIKVKGNGEQEHISCDELVIPFVDQRRLCMYTEPQHLQAYESFFPRLHSLLFFTPTYCYRSPALSLIFCYSKLLRVLDIEQVYSKAWASEVGLLVQLIYLAIRVSGNVCSALGKLSVLVTLILNIDGGSVSLPDTLWNLQKLRHLYSRHGAIELPIDNSDNSCNLPELQTLSTIRVTDCSVMEKQMRNFPNLRRMKCEFFDPKNHCSVADFSFLSRLESLSLSIYCYKPRLLEVNFPESLKKLAMRGFSFLCDEITRMADLPNLEVLKLRLNSFHGETWHVEEEEFSKLRFLKLDFVSLVYWTAASEYLFPNLEKLVLRDCRLKKIPECLQNVANLELIEVSDCSDEVVSLAKKVYDFHKEMGNSAIQFHEHRTEC